MYASCNPKFETEKETFVYIALYTIGLLFRQIIFYAVFLLVCGITEYYVPYIENWQTKLVVCLQYTYIHLFLGGLVKNPVGFVTIFFFV